MMRVWLSLPCGARTRSGGRCGNRCVAGSPRCRLHGGLGGRKPGFRAHPNTVAALKAGRERWLQKMRVAKEAGLIRKLPIGRKPGVSGRVRSRDKRVAAAQLALERMAEAMRNPMPQLPAVTGDSVKPWAEQTKAERLSTLTDQALEVTRQILTLPIDTEDLKDPASLKLISIVKDAALSTIAASIKVNDRKLQAEERRQEEAISEILRRVAESDRAAAAKTVEAAPGDRPKREKKP